MGSFPECIMYDRDNLPGVRMQSTPSSKIVFRKPIALVRCFMACKKKCMNAFLRKPEVKMANHYTFLGNCPPTPSPSQH